MTLTPKVRQIAFGVYVAIRNSGDAYYKKEFQRDNASYCLFLVNFERMTSGRCYVWDW